MTKKILIILSLLIALTFQAQALTRFEKAAKNFFPSIAKLTGGKQYWLKTAMKQETTKDHTKYYVNYSHFSPKGEVLLNIKRKKKYEVNAEIYIFKTILKAHDFFAEQAAKGNQENIKRVRFGDIGAFYFYPKSKYINDADFHLIFISKTFVVKVNADDGFALMDVAYGINRRLSKFVADNYKLYLKSKLTIMTEANGFKGQAKELLFTGESPSVVKINGIVLDKESRPIKNAEIRISETGKSTKTDNMGKYEFVLKLEGENPYEFKNNFFLTPLKKEKKLFTDGYYTVETTYEKTGKKQVQTWMLNIYGNAVRGEASIKIGDKIKTFPLTGSIHGKKLDVKLDCSNNNSVYGCNQTYKGNVGDKFATGGWRGTGGGGHWKLDKNSFTSKLKQIILDQANTKINPAVFFKGEVKFLNDWEGLFISSGMGNTRFLQVRIKPDKLNINKKLVKRAVLELTRLPGGHEGNIKIYKYNLEKDPKTLKIIPGQLSFTGELESSDEPQVVGIDITDYLLGDDKPLGIAVGPLDLTSKTSKHRFAGIKSSFRSLKPRLILTMYTAKENIKKKLPPIRISYGKRMKDYVGVLPKVTGDSQNDIELKTIFALQGKTLEEIHFENLGPAKRKWNTVPFDIYPVVGVVKEGNVINLKDGTIKYPLEKSEEELYLYLHKGSLENAEIDLRYRMKISGTWYEGSIKK